LEPRHIAWKILPIYPIIYKGEGEKYKIRLDILDMAPKRPDTMADTVIAKCEQNRQLNAFFPFLVLFGANILSFYE